AWSFRRFREPENVGSSPTVLTCTGVCCNGSELGCYPRSRGSIPCSPVQGKRKKEKGKTGLPPFLLFPFDFFLDKCPWPSGRGAGLPNRAGGFDSHRALSGVS